MGGGLNSDRIARVGLAKKLSVEQRPQKVKTLGMLTSVGKHFS